jgi:hypothetical protein
LKSGESQLPGTLWTCLGIEEMPYLLRVVEEHGFEENKQIHEVGRHKRLQKTPPNEPTNCRLLFAKHHLVSKKKQ